MKTFAPAILAGFFVAGCDFLAAANPEAEFRDKVDAADAAFTDAIADLTERLTERQIEAKEYADEAAAELELLNRRIEAARAVE